MAVLREFERRLEGLVEGLFAKTFRSGLQPVELAKRVLREMDARKTLWVGEICAPNRFVFSLSSEDGDRFEQAEGALVAELQRVIRENAAERGWGLVGPPQVEFEVDEDLGRGRFHCEASLAEGGRKAPAGEPDAGPAASLVLLEGERAVRVFRIGRQVVILGRSPECDVVLDDAGASRRHSQIRRDGDSYVLTDLGSTNGTLVDDVPIQQHTLEEGDRVTIGTSVLEFRRA